MAKNVRGKKKTIRVGVVGVGRGQSFMRGAASAGLELVAICDIWKERLEKVGKEKGVATFTDFDKMLEYDLDAVVLANYFHEHAPLAIKALKAGKHVMSECAACHTLAEGVALARAVEKSGKIYMLAENYPYMVCNQEMRRVYQSGRIGQFRYGEGEYVHPDPADVKMRRSCGMDHWRHWIPATYYCTHSIAPVMFITDTRPVKISAFVIPYDRDDPTVVNTVKLSDIAAPMLIRMDNGAVMKSLHGSLRGHGNHVRIHGNRGVMETCRHGDKNRLRIWREAWEKRKGEPVEVVYKPDFPVHHAEATKTGHGGGDFFTNYYFAEAIRTGKQPYLDVYRAIDMTLCGIQGWRSALAGGEPMEIPDFRKESVRKKYARDEWSPDPSRKKAGQPASSILGRIAPSRQAIAASRKIWAQQGYAGN